MRKTPNTTRPKNKTRKPTLTKETVKDLKLPARDAGIVKGGGASYYGGTQ